MRQGPRGQVVVREGFPLEAAFQLRTNGDSRLGVGEGGKNREREGCCEDLVRALGGNFPRPRVAEGEDRALQRRPGGQAWSGLLTQHSAYSEGRRLGPREAQSD